MALTEGRAVAKTTARAAQLNQLIDFLEGASGESIALMMRVAAANDGKIVLPDNAGARSFKVLDSDLATIWSVNSNGDMAVTGTLTLSGGMILPASAVPAVTTEGAIQWDSDDDRIVVGNGAGVTTFYPGAQLRQRHKYKTTGQNFTTTTLADVTATSGNVAFAVEANKVYKVTCEVLASAVGTAGSGGLKWAFTFPASPTIARASVHGPVTTNNTEAVIVGLRSLADLADITSGTAFGGTVRANAGTLGIQAGTFYLSFYLVNGANAGTVTLQAAQQTAAGTSTITFVHAEMIELDAE